MGRLVDGSAIQEARTSRFPTTEEVFSALGVVVNKGNLGALQEITDETYQAVAGREGQFNNLVPRLAEPCGSVVAPPPGVVIGEGSLNPHE